MPLYMTYFDHYIKQIREWEMELENNKKPLPKVYYIIFV